MFHSLSTHSKGIIITALGVIMISPDGLLNRLITADVLTITFFRGLFYSFGMLLVLTMHYRTRITAALFGIGWPGVCLATLYFVGNLSFIYSITHTAVANTLFIISTTPLFAALISWWIFREQVMRRTWIAIFVAAAGIAVICSGKSIMPNAYLGNIAGLFAALTLAASFTVVSKNRSRDLLPSFVFGGLLSVLVLFPFVSPAQTSASDLKYLFLMGFVMLPVAASLMFIGPRYISAPEVSLMMLLESIFGPLWVWFALNEHPGNLTLAGGSIVLITLVVHGCLGIRDKRHG